MMKYFFYTVLVSLSLISCGYNDSTIDDPKPIDKEVYHFQFKNYAVKNTVLYKGSAGQKSNPDESYLGQYWSLYQEPAWKKINLDLKNKSIQFISDTSTKFEYSFNIVNDSVLIKDNGNKPSYIGDFNKNTSTFSLKRTFRYVKKAPRNHYYGMLVTQNTLFGTTQYENIFGNEFAAPSEMTQADDQVLWSNIEYYYKAL
ncbi:MULTISPECIES: hypothetical protein [unclassified Chryseobacterium]|uniref:hypothetical protein n=1 Tax=unclassified Chryseobacterium TaxID=2593645 RepID=UPI000F450F55|nr:hypothetical protein [Chryseobacterium sp. G0240]